MDTLHYGTMKEIIQSLRMGYDVTGTIVESVPGQRLVFTWKGAGQEKQSQVTLVLQKVAATTTSLALEDKNIDSRPEFEEATIGWAQVLAPPPLKSTQSLRPQLQPII